ncbi:MAG: TetR/AcrR family transcriptional regulator [Candidatus Hydrogenedentes bacterium]|nr:TetR/AcrR family transcriptional regulator [Candidatus Hydrogenedentota bacterium]
MAHHDPTVSTRKEREREAHRRDILDAAEKVFILRGFHKATVEQIAQEADFSVGTLYNFFKNKEELYIEVLEKITEEFRGDFERNVKGEPDAVRALENLIVLRVMHWDSHRGFFRIFLENAPGSQMDPVPAFPERVREMYRSYLVEVSKVFERGMGQHVFRQADPLYLTLCLEGITNASAAYWAQHGTNEPLEARIEKVRDAFFRWIEAVSPPAGVQESR